MNMPVPRFNWPGLFVDEYPGSQLVAGHVVPCCYDLGLTPGQLVAVFCAHRSANKAGRGTTNVMEPVLHEAVSLKSAHVQMWPCWAEKVAAAFGCFPFRISDSAERRGVPLTRHLQMRADPTGQSYSFYLKSNILNPKPQKV